MADREPTGYPVNLLRRGEDDDDLAEELAGVIDDRSKKTRRGKKEPESWQRLPAEMSPDEILWNDFQVKPNWPLRTKVEHLFMFYRLPARDISKLTGVGEELIESEIEALKNDWIDLGRIPQGAERELHRGKVIAKLRRMEATIESALMSCPEDSKLLTLLLNVQDRISKLLGLEMDKKETPSMVLDDTDPFTRASQVISELSPDRLQILHARLNRKKDQPSCDASSEPS